MAGDDDVRAELERLKAENERLKGQQARGVTLKVSEKGGVSVYGMGRFPITLYKPVQGAVDQAARHGGRDPRVHQGERTGAEGERDDVEVAEAICRPGRAGDWNSVRR
jgi:hypothetical protein